MNRNATAGTPSRFIRPGWRRAPLLSVLATQAVGAAIALGAAVAATAWLEIDVPLFAVLVAQGAIAALLGARLVGLPRWWIPIQMVMPPAAALASRFAVPGWVYLALFLVLMAIYWNAARSRVPLYLTNRGTHRALAALLPATAGARFIDIGHGFAGTVLALARERPDMAFDGIESAPLPFVLSWVRATLARRPNVRLIYGDFWRRSLTGYDVVYAFLSPAPMEALYAKAQREMGPGTLLVSNSFAVPGRAADAVHTLDDTRTTELFIYRM